MTAKDVWQGTIGNVAIAKAGETAVGDFVDDPDVEVVVVVDAGWDVVDERDSGLDVPPQLASPSASLSASASAPINAVASLRLPRWMRRLQRPTPYASTVRASSRSAKRRCASARRVGMCSDGTSCAENPLSTRRATVWRCTSSGPS